ncbi:MAG: Peroxiredoxin [Bacteroidetes bacterium]|nr:Peroxiredoxin [Bacteroidota bacterium]
MKNRFLLFAFCVLMTPSFAQTFLTPGTWSGVLKLNDSTQLPFDFEVQNAKGKLSLMILNAQEQIKVDELSFAGDSVFIKMPVFDSEFRCQRITAGKMKGVWINHARKNKNVIAFEAFAKAPDESKGKPETFVPTETLDRGKWEATFSKGTPDEYKAIGVFKTKDLINVSGTFSTETGDYRYLSGKVKDNNTFYLACFDGAHAFMFTGKVQGDSIVNGRFYSGIHGEEPWEAVHNDNFELRNPDSLTFLKPGFTKVDFNFKNLEGKYVSLSDDKFKNKVVMIQIMGSWCPNCMDETKFLAGFYDTYKKQGLEIVGLAFERTDDFAKAVNNVQRLKTRFGANYEFLITMKTGADQASQALPMLNKVMAFPTTIYIDKKGMVRKIYTGFYGPATGEAYKKYVEETTQFVEMLLKE